MDDIQAPHSLATPPTFSLQVASDVGRAATEWISNSLAFFDPDRVPTERRRFVTKAAVELALLAAHASRLHATTNHPVAYSRILDFLTEVFARQTVTSYCARDRDNSLLYGLASTALGVCGRPNHKLEWVVRQTLYVTNSLHAERTPFRELDLLHLLHLRGDAHPTLKADDVFKRTLLACKPSVVTLRDTDVYAITHTIFYLTDFGMRSYAGFEHYQPFVSQFLEWLLRHHRVIEDADLVGELIACQLCVTGETPECAKGWNYLRTVQYSDGHIAGPAYKLRRLSGLVDDTDFARWCGSYHTTLVAALAGLITQHILEHNPEKPSTRLPLWRHPSTRSDFRESVDLAASWLADLVSSPQQQSLTVLLLAAAGLALVTLCQPDCRRGQEGLRNAALSLVDYSSGAILENNIEAVLLVAEAISKANLLCEPFVSAVAQIAAAIGDPPTGRPWDMYWAYASLVRLGICKPSPAILVDASFFNQDWSDIDESAQFAYRLVRFGAIEGTTGSVGSQWEHAVEHMLAHAINAANAYQLEIAAVFVRALISLGSQDDIGVVDTVDFLLLQQTPEGSFGYRDTGNSPQEAQLIDRLNCSISVLCVLRDLVTASSSGHTGCVGGAAQPEIASDGATRRR